MFTRPRHHSPDRWARERCDDIRAAAMTLARILGAETRHYRWRDGRGPRGRQRRWAPRSGPRWSDSPPGRFQCSAQRRHWRPHFYNNWRWGRNFETYPQSKTSTIGEPTCCPEEALLWQRSESPVCRKKKKCAGGSLMGQNHEALCGEARNVSQRSTAAAQERAPSPGQGKRNGEWRREETRHHHGGEKWG